MDLKSNVLCVIISRIKIEFCKRYCTTSFTSKPTANVPGNVITISISLRLSSLYSYLQPKSHNKAILNSPIDTHPCQSIMFHRYPIRNPAKVVAPDKLEKSSRAPQPDKQTSFLSLRYPSKQALSM